MHLKWRAGRLGMIACAGGRALQGQSPTWAGLCAGCSTEDSSVTAIQEFGHRGTEAMAASEQGPHY